MSKRILASLTAVKMDARMRLSLAARRAGSDQGIGVTIVSATVMDWPFP